MTSSNVIDYTINSCSQKNKINNITTLSDYEKLKYFDELIIEYPKFKELLLAIDECKNSVRYSKQPECLSLVGTYRSGKSTIIKRYMKKYPDSITTEGTIKPILYSLVPCPATYKGLVSSLLENLGDPFYSNNSTGYSKTSRLKDLLKKCKVELIILDEVQHLIDSNKRKLIQETADWFKNLIADTNIPVVFVGLDNATQIFQENKQLGSRVLNRYTIEPFDYDDKSFRIVLYYFDTELPLENVSGLSNDNMWKYIYIATQGKIGYIKVLLKESLKIALEENNDIINVPILAKAYEHKLSPLYDRNPFLPGFNLTKELVALKTRTSKEL